MFSVLWIKLFTISKATPGDPELARVADEKTKSVPGEALIRRFAQICAHKGSFQSAKICANLRIIANPQRRLPPPVGSVHPTFVRRSWMILLLSDVLSA